MRHHPKKFWLYMAPFIAVVPLTLIFFVITNSITHVRHEQILLQLTAALQENLNADLEYLDAQGDEVAQLSNLQHAVLENDYESIIAILLAERTERNIGLMGMANQDGYIIARTKTINGLGEHVFSNAPQGRAIANGAPGTASIEISTFDQRGVLMTTARPLIHDNEMIGALFANYLLDDDYARASKNKYLQAISPQTEVAFYTDTNGVYGSSFNDTALKEAVSSHFSPKVLSITPAHTFVQIDGTHYHVRNLPFEGLESSDTGALIFLPVANTTHLVLASFLLAHLCAFIAEFIIRKRA